MKPRLLLLVMAMRIPLLFGLAQTNRIQINGPFELVTSDWKVQDGVPFLIEWVWKAADKEEMSVSIWLRDADFGDTVDSLVSEFPTLVPPILSLCFEALVLDALSFLFLIFFCC